MEQVKDDLDPQTRAQAIEMVREARELADKVAKNRDGNQGVATVHVNAGGVGVWIAVCCCITMLAAGLVTSVIGSVWLAREFARVDKELNERKEEGQRMQSYLSAIYVQAPQLKPEDEESSQEKTRN